MSARRQPSTTSLSKFARANSPVLQNNRSLDFVIHSGVMAMEEGAVRTMEELRLFWKERAVIEEDYAKRLAKLAKITLGRDEIGDLRISLDTVKLETERQSGFHMGIAQQIRTDLEAPTAAFNARQIHHKKTYQTGIEKEILCQQIAREIRTGCLRINSFTAQASLVQGKDLEKINLKLERTQQTVQTNERDFANYSKALQDTVQKWEQDWKSFCDSCQDLEEHRLEFMKDNLWAYANAVSTVCVADDESCEKIRLALEQMEPEKDMENFVQQYGTGNEIPNPPTFVNYQATDSIPSASARPTSRPANFIRTSARELPPRQISMPPEEEPIVNTAGVGAGGGQKRADTYSDASDALSRQPTRGTSAPNAQAQQAPYANGNGRSSHPAVPASPQQQQQQLQRVLQDPYAEPIDPAAETYIKVGNNAYKVDLSKDPQQQTPSSEWAAAAAGGQQGPVDPLMKQLEELKNAVSTSGSVRRNTMNTRSKPSASPEPKPGHLSTPSASRTLTNGGGAGPRSPSPARDYRNSAEVVVGAHPSVSRPTSPNPPTAAFMQPKSAPPPSGNEVQSLPGERKSISRSNSPSRGHVSNMSQASLNGQNLARPPSQMGHAGIGAHGSRSNTPSQAFNQGRTNFIQPPAQIGHNMARTPSPNSVGIALDPSGRKFQQQQQQQQRRPSMQTQQPAYQAPPPPQQAVQQQQQGQRRNSFVSPVSRPGIWCHTTTWHVQQTPSPQPSYHQPPPVQAYQAPPPPQQQPMLQQQPAQMGYGSVNSVNSLNRGGSMSYYGNQTPPQQQQMQAAQQVQPMQQQQQRQMLSVQTQPQQPQQQQQPVYQQPQQQQQAQYLYRDSSPARRSPSPQPPPQATDDGNTVLFYVKALYDYSATIEEEFDFQAGDIIAVTATPEDGWWSGELLDENRRQKGRNVFPSNFVCLF
ncbi:SH3 domain-containing protein [Pholiota molesta]|nr:SH3 domain-containing protein [Pholiota molesta]